MDPTKQVNKDTIANAVTFGVFILILAGAFALSRVDYSWGNWRPASCMPDNCFCEAIRPGPIVQPANTWSSFSFMLIGLMIMNGRRALTAPADQFSRPQTLPRKAYANTYGLALILIGLGSALYHASLTFVGQFFDLMGMYLLGTFILLYNLVPLSRVVRNKFVHAYVLINLVLAITLILLPHWRRYLFAVLIFAALLPVFAQRRKQRPQSPPRFLLAALAAFVLAYLIWLVDFHRIFCFPESWLQGHAFWHLLSATAAGLLYMHYRSEKPEARV